MFHVKRSFCSKEIQYFVLPLFSTFLPGQSLQEEMTEDKFEISTHRRVSKQEFENSFCWWISWEVVESNIETWSIDRILYKVTIKKHKKDLELAPSFLLGFKIYSKMFFPQKSVSWSILVL